MSVKENQCTECQIASYQGLYRKWDMCGSSRFLKKIAKLQQQGVMTLANGTLANYNLGKLH